jgi:hypothetical protein
MHLHPFIREERFPLLMAKIDHIIGQ